MIAALAGGGWLLAVAIVVSAHRAAASRATGVARACHELRGPLFAIGLGVELAGHGGALPSERVRGLELELGRARQALDDLARAGGVDADLGLREVGVCAEPDPGPRADLAALLRESAPGWRDRAGGRALRVELPPFAVLVTGERLRFAQALGNLVGNAVEHGDGEVVVRLRAVPGVPGVGGVVGVGGVARVEVCDEGPGLPVPLAALLSPRRRRHAWLPWSRVPAHGHGLRIVAAVAATHGGRLISAPTARGARMVLELPLAPPLSGDNICCQNEGPGG